MNLDVAILFLNKIQQLILIYQIELLIDLVISRIPCLVK